MSISDFGREHAGKRDAARARAQQRGDATRARAEQARGRDRIAEARERNPLDMLERPPLGFAQGSWARDGWRMVPKPLNAAKPEEQNRQPQVEQAEAAVAEPLPLTLEAAGLDGGGVALVRVIPGFINSLQPTLDDDPLDDDPFPTISVTANIWVWAKCVGTFGEAGDDTYVVTIETSATSAVPAGSAITATGFTSFRSIGRAIFIEAGNIIVVKNHSGGNLGVESFGNVNHWWIQ